MKASLIKTLLAVGLIVTPGITLAQVIGTGSTSDQNVVPRQNTATPPSTSSQGGAQSTFQQWDTNGDGVLDQAEFAAAEAAGLVISDTSATAPVIIPGTPSAQGSAVTTPTAPAITPENSNTAPNVNQGRVFRPSTVTNPSAVPAGGRTGMPVPPSPPSTAR